MGIRDLDLWKWRWSGGLGAWASGSRWNGDYGHGPLEGKWRMNKLDILVFVRREKLSGNTSVSHGQGSCTGQWELRLELASFLVEYK